MAEAIATDYYYTIRTNDESFYFCKIANSSDIFTVTTEDGMEVISETTLGDHKFIKLSDIFVILQTQDGPIPVEYSKMPGGSKVLWVSVGNIASFNVIDSNGKLKQALDQIVSGIITKTESPDVAQSSRNLKR